MRRIVKIKRQERPETQPYWETFALEASEQANVILLLMEIQKNPVTEEGKRTEPVEWDCSCLEEVCGACTMIINGKVRQACSTLIKELQAPIILQPLEKFPVIRDLRVERQVMFDNLKRANAWIDIDGTYPAGPGPRMPERDRRWAYELARCMTCGACLEACPQFKSRSSFMGAALIAQVRLFNTHPIGEQNKEARLDVLMGPDGIAGCAHAQNCERVCPKGIPLLRSIAEMERATLRHAIRRLLSF